MRRLLRALLVVLATFGALAVAAFVLVESGEVVVVRSRDDAGRVHRFRLWVADYGGYPWISTGNPSTRRWHRRVLAHPEVELVRGDETSCRSAVLVEDAPTKDAVRRAFADKYRIPSYGSAFLNWLVAPTGDPAGPIVIRLEPCR
jgi:hypothetical protein